MRMKTWLLAAVVAVFAVSSWAGNVVIKYVDPFTGNVNPLAGTKVGIFTLDGTLIAYTSPSNDAGLAVVDGRQLSDGLTYLVAAISSNNAGSVVPHSSCVGDLLARVLGSGTPVYPPVETVPGVILRNSTTKIKVEKGGMVHALAMLAKSREAALADFGVAVPPVKAYWNACSGFDEDWPRFVSVNEDFMFGEFISNIIGQRIDLYSEWAASYRWLFSVVAHEYGHWMHYSMAGNALPRGDGPDPHYLYSESSREFALVEGWAEFFSDFVLEREGLRGLNDLEQFAGDYPNTLSIRQEGRVAGFLWDIVDNPTSDDDYVAESAVRVARIISDYGPTGVDSFAYRWREMYGHGLDDLYQNTFGEPIPGSDTGAVPDLTAVLNLLLLD